MCVEIEGLQAAETAPADLLGTVRTLRGRWLSEVAGRGVDPDTARQFDQRFTTALNATVAKYPEAFASDLDPRRAASAWNRSSSKAETLAKSVAADSAQAAEECRPPTASPRC